VTDLTSAPSRRAFKEAHGRWPKAGDLGPTRYTVTFSRAAPAAPPSREAATVPPKSPERAAWDVAYSQPGELGPVGGTWPADGRHVPRMVWRLPLNTGINRPTPPRN
jgi:hypothetical protein